MRILHVIRTLDPAWGGPVAVVRSLAATSASRGIISEIVCLDDPSAEWLRFWHLPVAALGKGVSSFGFSRKLDRWLAAEIIRFDVIIVHSIWMYFSMSARRAAARNGVPYFLYIHGALDPWFKRRYPLKHIKKLLYWRLFEHKTVRDAAAVIFTTEEEKHLAHNAFTPYSCNAAVVGCGTDIPQEAVEPVPQDAILDELTSLYPDLKHRNYFLYLGRIHEKKGVDLLLRGFAQAKINSNMALVIAGPGDAALIKELRMLSAQLGIQDKTIWAGPLYGPIKWQALKGADAFVLVSHQENFGISVAESLSCGRPVLISDKVNIWREIEADGAGLVDSDDVDGATRLFERWNALPAGAREAMGQGARQCFTTHFDIERSSDRLFTLIFTNSNAMSRTAACAVP